jgi:hypothetical protein
MNIYNEKESLEKIAAELKHLKYLKYLPTLINELSVLTDVLAAMLQAIN